MKFALAAVIAVASLFAVSAAQAHSWHHHHHMMRHHMSRHHMMHDRMDDRMSH